ncbi:hypothetical protein [Caballeronia sp. DA-9]|uniref:hypothetical protein n=1 Tax=Caballeronia sp. DA-9 TaxID=3436237 RepID=UPI003F667F24
MARRAASTDELFAVAEATLIGLYNAGVLSPAVLERVIAGFADSSIDWHSRPTRNSVDGKSLHEVVAITMMPGRAIRNPLKEFFAVIGHVGSSSVTAPDEQEKPEESADDEPDDDLMNQLAGMSSKSGAGRKRAAKTTRKSAPSPGFNPLFHAAPPGRSRKS